MKLILWKYPGFENLLKGKTYLEISVTCRVTPYCGNCERTIEGSSLPNLPSQAWKPHDTGLAGFYPLFSVMIHKWLQLLNLLSLVTAWRRSQALFFPFPLPSPSSLPFPSPLTFFPVILLQMHWASQFLFKSIFSLKCIFLVFFFNLCS